MNEFNYRFAVGSLEGVRSSSYTIFTNPNKSDVYIGHRGVVGDYKVSLHESGKNYISFTNQTKHPHAIQRIKMNNGNRHMHTWKGVKVHSILDIYFHFRIIFPTSELRLIKRDINEKPLNWVEPAPIDYQIEICIITSPFSDSNYPRLYDYESKILKDFLLPNGNKIWIIGVIKPHEPILFQGHKSRGSSNSNERGIAAITSHPVPGFVDFAMD